jgi:hypothetical protein
VQWARFSRQATGGAAVDEFGVAGHRARPWPFRFEGVQREMLFLFILFF